MAAELIRDMGHKGNSCGGNDPHTIIQCLSPLAEMVLETPGTWLCCRSQSSCLPDPEYQLLKNRAAAFAELGQEAGFVRGFKAAFRLFVECMDE